MSTFDIHHSLWRVCWLTILLAIGIMAGKDLKSFHNNVQRMKIYEYDDYDDCRRVYTDFVYCVLQLGLVPDTTLELLHSIQNYSSSPRHFDRRTIEVGLCLQNCQPSHDKHIDNVTLLINDCLEEKIWTKYKLKYSLKLATCSSATESYGNPEEFWIKDVAGAAFIMWVVGAFLLAICATSFDSAGCSKLPEKSKKSFLSLIIQSFSLRRNLPNLIKRDERTKLHLHHLDGIRALTMVIILLSHSVIPLIKMPLKNVDHLEAQFDQFWFPVAMAGNTYIVQLFFVIGGLLLAVNVLHQTKSSAVVGMYYFKDRVKTRLIRILPTYIFVILFHMSWYTKCYDGPIGNRFKDHCTNNWWTNLLFINNYVNSTEPCIQFTWYLGADFQLYLLGTALMIMIRNRPQLMKVITFGMIFSAFLVPCIVIYKYQLDATVMMILRYILQEIRTLPYYAKVYIPFETNAGNYFFGMIAGIFYYKFKDNPEAVKKFKPKYALLGSAIYFVLMNGLTPMLPSDHLPHPSMGLAIFGSLLKSSWGIFPSILVLFLAFYKTPYMLESMLKHPILLVAARLSYAVYLAQYGIIYIVYKHITYPLMYNSFTILIFTASISTITICIALLLHLLVEIPCNKLFRRILCDDHEKHL